jgi:hypothetical protein
MYGGNCPQPPGQGPLPCGPFCAPPGWFATLEIDVVSPNFHNHLIGPVPIGPVTTQVAVPGATLDWTGSPHFELGYRLADGAGAFLAGYRSLVTSGTATIPNYDAGGPGGVKSLLNMNVVDIEYRNGPCSIAPFWDFSWDVGARIGAAYYSSRAQGAFLQQQVTNNFVGGGPRAGLELTRQIEVVPGLGLFGRLEGGAMIGWISQSYEQTMQVGGGRIGGAFDIGHGQTVPFVTFLTGLSYAPPTRGQWMRFSGGYLFEQWWSLGDMRGLASSGDLTFQGLFFRGEFNF